MHIRTLDENRDWESWIVEDICGDDWKEYLSRGVPLTMKRLEKHTDEIIEKIEIMKRNVNNPPKYGNKILNIDDAHAGFQILAVLIIETGAFLPEIVKANVLESTTWEFDKRWEWDPNALNIRKFYLNDFREKILNHQPGQSQKLIDLKIYLDSELNKTCIGLNQLKLYVRSGKINNVDYINLDSLNLTEIPNLVLKLDQIQKLSLDNNNIAVLPPNIDNLKNLKFLSLLNNKIESLPECFKNLSKLDELILFGNPILNNKLNENMLPSKIVKRIKKTKKFLKKK